ncbi:DUF4886 domain-containing protein [Roseibium sp.]|uniref:DUF4886 domain-containing protein n=1 Tax=Roseibium sp. TaxID=1936156 RepID=UPI003B50EA27
MLKTALFSILTFCILPVLTLTAGASPASGLATKVLFVGNSLTLRNDLPGMLKEIAATKGIPVETSTSAKGSARLAHHSGDAGLLQLMDETAWDFVILQEHTQLPALDDTDVERDSFPFAAELAARARKVSAETQVVFYMGMAHREGDQFHKKKLPAVGSYKGMQDRTNATYRKMAKHNDALLAPVGEVWARMRADHPDIELYVDERHPSVAGTYLAACVFFTTLFAQSCDTSFVPGQLEGAVAATIQRVSDAALLR